MAHNQEDIIMKRVMTIFAEQAVGYFGETKKVKNTAPTELVDIEEKLIAGNTLSDQLEKVMEPSI